MFEKATRQKIRFDTPRGQITTEDLWDLPLSSINGVNLDKIAVGISKQLKEETTESFVVESKKSNDLLQLKFDVVKHVITVKLAERETAKAKADATAKKDRILEIIARKQDQALEGQSLEDLQKMVASL